MTTKEAQELYEKLADFYGEKLANFQTNPKLFAYQVKLYKYLQENK